MLLGIQVELFQVQLRRETSGESTTPHRTGSEGESEFQTGLSRLNVAIANSIDRSNRQQSVLVM